VEHHAVIEAFARLGGEKAGGGGIADCARPLAVQQAAKALGGVAMQFQAFPYLDGRQGAVIGRLAEQVDRISSPFHFTSAMAASKLAGSTLKVSGRTSTKTGEPSARRRFPSRTE
jgi:hypothetical protein